MTLKIKVIIFIGVFCVSTLLSQNVSVFGIIKDSVTGESLIGANIFILSTKIGCSANNFGFYSINVPQNITLKLEISYVGYSSQFIDINLAKDSVFNIYLSPIVLKQVEIKDSRNTVVRHGEITIPIEKLKAIPSLGGEADILKALAFLPGIAAGVEGTSGLYIRGGTPDQNLILLDGATVYNTSHLFGFLSIFNPEAIKAMSVYKGGFPARFGGRLSSVIDVTMKEGNNQKNITDFNIGTVTSSFLTEGPFKKNKSSFMVSGRASYSSLLTLISVLSYQGAKQADLVDFLMYDVNAKMNFDLSNHEKLFISGYFGNDFFDGGSKYNGSDERTSLGWANQTASLRYTNIIKPNLFANVLLNFNRYNYHQRNTIQDDTINYLQTDFVKSSTVQDWATKISFDYNSGKHNVKFGTEIALHTFQPDKLHEVLKTPDLAIRDNPDTLIHSLSASFFIEDNFTISPKWNLNYGVHFSNYFVSGQHYYQLEPRLIATYFLNEQNELAGSISRMSQYIHLLSSSTSGNGPSNDIWVPATQQVPLETAWQGALSWTHKFINSDWNLQLETFYKKMNGLIEFKGGQNIYSFDTNWQSLIEKNGIGVSYGAEFLLKKEGIKHSGWLSYTLAWSERKFDNINNGNWYPQHYDRRHNFNIVYANKLSEKWTFNSNFIFQTGYAITLPDAVYYDYKGILTPFYSSKNNARAPIYNRLDISFTKTYKNKKGHDCKWIFSLYNVYGYPNPFAVSYSKGGFTDGTFITSTDPFGNIIKTPKQVGYSGNIETISPFNFIPGLNWSIKF